MRRRRGAGYRSGSSPSRTAMESASSLECAPSLAERLAMWLRTVCTLTLSVRGDRRVGQAVGEQGQHLALALGQLAARGGAAAVQPGQQPGQQLGGDHRLAGGRRADRGRDLLQAAGLGDEARGPRLDRRHQHVVGGARGEHHDPDARSDRRSSPIAATPSPSGSRWSSSTTSGAVVSISVRARAIVPAVPTTSRSGWSPRTAARLALSTSWSSTISTRTGRSSVDPGTSRRWDGVSMVAASSRRRHWDRTNSTLAHLVP